MLFIFWIFLVKRPFVSSTKFIFSVNIVYCLGCKILSIVLFPINLIFNSVLYKVTLNICGNINYFPTFFFDYFVDFFLMELF
jgi:hypothetical protein